MKLFMLYYPSGSAYRLYSGTIVVRNSPEYKLGGGSSTKPAPRLYETLKKAEAARDRYFNNAAIKEVEI